MTLSFSTSVIEAMGFRRATESQPVAGSFYSINVYAIRGITLDADALAISKGSIGDATYSLAVGSKLNSLAQVLLGDDFVDDEVSWANEKKCSQKWSRKSEQRYKWKLWA